MTGRQYGTGRLLPGNEVPTLDEVRAAYAGFTVDLCDDPDTLAAVDACLAAFAAHVRAATLAEIADALQ